MFLPINDQYRLAADSRCWMIEEKRPRKRKGVIRDEWTPIRWYSTLAQAAEGYAEFRLRTSDANNVVEALAEIKRIAAELCEALRPMPHVIAALQAAERQRATISRTTSP
jgi:hypothetical protein